MTRFVLIHGAFMGSWAWDHVASGLRAAGHQVDAPDLPGTGDGLIADVTLERYVNHIGAVLSDGPPAVLVGHSLGGVTIAETAALHPSAVTGMVFLAAFLPRGGQSAADLMRLPEGSREGLTGRMVMHGGDRPHAILAAADAAEVLFNTCPPETIARAVSRLGPHAPWIASTPVSAPAESVVPLAYVVCTQDRAIPPELQRRMAREAGCTPITELQTDHCPHLSSPAAVVEVLLAFARTLARPSRHPQPPPLVCRSGARPEVLSSKLTRKRTP